MSQHALQTHERSCLPEMHQTILPVFNVLHVSRLCYRFSRDNRNQLLPSQMARSDRSSYICANWLNNTSHDVCRPGYVQFFFKHNMTLENLIRIKYLLRVSLRALDGTNHIRKRIIYTHLSHCGTLTLNRSVLLHLCPSTE